MKNENHFRLSLFVIGFTGMITLVIVLRTFFLVFKGNELGLGVVLGNWFLISALGSFLGRKIKFAENKNAFLFASHLLIGILPPVTVFLIYYSNFLFFPPGSAVSLMDIFLISLAILLPFCFLTGYMFAFLAVHLSHICHTSDPVIAFSIEKTGSFAGGLLFSILMIFAFDSFVTLKLLMVIHFGIALFVTYSFRSSLVPRIVGILAIGLAGFFFLINLKSVTEGYLYRYQNMITEKETPYGSLVVTEMAGQFSFYENGIFLFSTNNYVTKEESVHYAMLQHQHPENVLLISGGISGTVAEILKYNIKSLDYVEINPGLIEIGKKYLTKIPDEKKVQVIGQDARFFLSKFDKVYDVVLINLPDPVNTHINRYYTLEFFEQIKAKLSASAVISVSLSSSAIYLSEEAKQIHTSLYSTLKLLFANVIIIPGMSNYFIASDGVISPNIALLAQYKKVNNSYVNSFYLDDQLINERRVMLESLVAEKVIVNYDFLPVGYLLQLRQWTRDLKVDAYIAGALVLLGLLFILPRLSTVNFGMFATGFSTAALHILFIASFQMIYGYVFFMIGILFTVFMAGLIAGSLLIVNKIKVTLVSFSVNQYIAGIFAVVVPIILMVIGINQSGNVVIHTIFILFAFISGLIAGTQFALGARLRIETIHKTVSGCYSSDLLGAGIGALFVSTFLIPYFGIVKVGLILGIINFLAGLLILVRSRRST